MRRHRHCVHYADAEAHLILPERRACLPNPAEMPPPTLHKKHKVSMFCHRKPLYPPAHTAVPQHALDAPSDCFLWRMHNRNPETLVLGVLSRSYVKRVQAAGPPVWLCENAGQQSPSNKAAVGTRKGNLLLLGTYSHLPVTPHLANGRTIAALRNANTPRRRMCSASRRTA